LLTSEIKTDSVTGLGRSARIGVSSVNLRIQPGAKMPSNRTGMMRSLTHERGVSTKTTLGLRALAMIEVAKGAVVLLLACGVLDLVHKNVTEEAERLAGVLHAKPDGELSRIFAKLASHATDRFLWQLAIGALIYVAVRFIEAHGLWHERDWAQWFELLSTALYLAPELYWLLRQPTGLKFGVLMTNLFILLFMLIVRVRLARFP
jgi:uncharacterized membrane protein (DUF2068 family)